MNNKVFTKKDIDRTIYVPIEEEDFYPPQDERILQSPFIYGDDYKEYREEYEEYIRDFN